MATESMIAPVGEVKICGACCCSITGCILDYPACCGAISDSVCCCLKLNQTCCKRLESAASEEEKCFLLNSGGIYCVQITQCIQGVCQCFCIDHRCALPCNDDVPSLCTCLPCCVLFAKNEIKTGCCKQVKDFVETAEVATKYAGGKKAKDVSDVPLAQILLCSACCCSTCGIFVDFPACCGFKSESICCCFQCESAGCKTVQVESEDKLCCICCEGNCYCVKVNTCIQQQCQLLCVDSRVGCPPCGPKVPCVCTLLPFCVVCAQSDCGFHCCARIKDIIPELGEAKGPQAPEVS